MYLIHVYDDRARIMARYVVSHDPGEPWRFDASNQGRAVQIGPLDDHLETIEREFPGCSINIAPKHTRTANERI